MTDYDDLPIADVQRQVLQARKRALDSGGAAQLALSEKVRSALAANSGRECGPLFDLSIDLYHAAIDAYNAGDTSTGEVYMLMANEQYVGALLCLTMSQSSTSSS